MALTIEPQRTGKPCAYCTDLTTHNVGRIGVCDRHIQRAVNNFRAMERHAYGPADSEMV